MMYYTYCFVYIETTLYLWNKTHLVVTYKLNIFTNLMCEYFLRTFVSIFNKKSLDF